MARILLAVPTFETITPDTFKSLWDMSGKTEHQVIFEFVRGYDCAAARNKIGVLAQDLNADYVMMVDSDTTVPAGALVHMLEHDVDVCAGYYMHRKSGDNRTTDHTNICKLADDDGRLFFGYPSESQMTGSELREKRDSGEYLVQIHGCGMGCILIKTSVFYKLRYPWFAWLNHPNDEKSSLSEDLYFCEQCHNEGIPIYVDTRINCGHMMRRIEYT